MAFPSLRRLPTDVGSPTSSVLWKAPISAPSSRDSPCDRSAAIPWSVLSFIVGPSTRPYARTHLLTACPPAVSLQGTVQTSRVPRVSLPACQALRHRWAPTPGQFGIAVLPSAAIKTSAPTGSHFGALSPWPTDSLSTLNRQRRRWWSKTRFRVVTSLARVGIAPTGNHCTVSVK